MRTRAVLLAFVVALCFATPAAAQFEPPDSLDGMWFLGEPSDDLEVGLRVSAGEGALINLRGERAEPREYPLAVEPMGEGHFLVTVNDGGRPTELHVALTGPNEGVAFEVGDDDIAIIRRLADVPEWLLGEWNGFEAGRGRQQREVTISADALVSSDGSRTDRRELYGLAPGTNADDQRLLLAIAREGDQPRVAILQAIPGGGYVLYYERQDEFIYLYRGEMPAWMVAASDRDRDDGDDGASESSPEVTLCTQAGERAVACAEAYCATAPPNPFCDDLETFRFMAVHNVPDCTPDMMEMARTMLEQSCDELVEPFTRLEEPTE